MLLYRPVCCFDRAVEGIEAVGAVRSWATGCRLRSCRGSPRDGGVEVRPGWVFVVWVRGVVVVRDGGCVGVVDFIVSRV